MNDILTQIVAHKHEELTLQQQAVSIDQLHESCQQVLKRPTLSMKQSLASSLTGIISEFKRKSPSKGWIHQDALPEKVAPAYEQAGAAALSVLTDEQFFGGRLRDICTIRPLVQIPILRKDFIINEYQLLQARIAGADAVLLIAACLTMEECISLAEKAHELGLEVLLEVHSPAELNYIVAKPDMLGVNNRNLGTFVTDVQNSFKLAKALRSLVSQIDNAPLLVSESGISRPETILSLREAGFRGFLMGEAFMKASSPGNALKQLIDNINPALTL